MWLAICVCVHVHVDVHVYTCACVRVCMHVCVCVPACVNMRLLCVEWFWGIVDDFEFELGCVEYVHCCVCVRMLLSAVPKTQMSRSWMRHYRMWYVQCNVHHEVWRAASQHSSLPPSLPPSSLRPSLPPDDNISLCGGQRRVSKVLFQNAGQTASATELGIRRCGGQHDIETEGTCT